MVIEAFVVENVPRQLHLGILRLLVLLLKVIGVLDFLILVALVIATRTLVVVLPRLRTHPAELVAAHLACHMVTPCALLDGSLALRIGAHLGVGQDPGEILGLSRALDLPLLKHFAVSWPVLLVAALKAERVTAEAVNN